MSKQWKSCEITEFFGDRKYLFRLPLSMIAEVESKSDLGIGAIFIRVIHHQATSTEIVQVLRCALIGGGTLPSDAQRLIDIYVEGFPLDPHRDLAEKVLIGTIEGFETKK